MLLFSPSDVTVDDHTVPMRTEDLLARRSGTLINPNPCEVPVRSTANSIHEEERRYGVVSRPK